MNNLLQIQQRYQILKGDPDGTCDTAGTSHINSVINDVVTSFPFSWTRSTATLTLANGVANLPTDYNPGWQLDDARIVGGTVFTPKGLDKWYDGLSDGYYITYNSTTNKFVFNCQTLTGTVTIFYHSDPSDLVNPTDNCVVVDGEAIAYGAAAKNWIGDERNVQLKQDYSQEYDRRVRAMQTQDQMFGPTYIEGSVIDDNPRIMGV